VRRDKKKCEGEREGRKRKVKEGREKESRKEKN